MDWISSTEWQIISLSLKVAFWAVLISLPFGVLAAYVLARWRFWGHSFLDFLIHLPLVLPPVVTGYLLLIIFGRGGWLGEPLASMGIQFSFHWTGAVLAAAIMAFPLMVRSIRLSIEAVDQRLEQASATLGASAWQIWWSITVPLCFPGILAGMMLAFAKALGEFGATITFVANIPGQTQTIPVAIYTALQSPGGNETVIRMVIFSIILAGLALGGSEYMARRFKNKQGVT